MTDYARLKITIQGRVQGVFFRSETQRKAKKLGLLGWVKNNQDGSVSCLVEGPQDKLDQFVEWSYQGSPSAQVSNVEIEKQEYQAEFKDFTILPS